MGLALMLSGCGESALEKIHQEGELVVLTRYAPTTYYIGRNGPEGPEYDLTQSFAEAAGVSVRYEIRDTIVEILQSIKNGEGDLAAAGLTRTEEREKHFHFGPAYKIIQQQVVCHRKGPVPDNMWELGDVTLQIIGRSSYEERLQELKPHLPGLTWESTDELATEQLLERVAKRKIHCTVADSNIVAINRRYYPQLVVAFPLAEEQALAWLLPPDSDVLQRALEEWAERVGKEGIVQDIEERYYGHVEIFDYVDLSRFRRRIRSRLPKYKATLEQAAKKYGVPWTVLAAQSYQESHWNPRSRSPTGVRGMMMLTLPTARELGIKSRLDPTQSIMGGAKYMARLQNRLPDDIPPEERIWFALAAYNVGFGHLMDARELAERVDKDPNRWRDMREVLPLLAHKRYYRTLRYGYARGSEPVRYVQRIRHYQDILEQYFPRS
ncbi:MAG: membrane-bound lytic murein transglycosylase MltF [Gammaproteobacteria bacterium]|nr:membrane-bound lytic murein transglycosylase MltF [Gammaproteobacteria bacterium]NIR85926.1 membrane-bound lytic murein transglycosylase MltF [Gammaproteobacteria bacterium]NIR91918.1 membrane-bound lytic murein transglycosylase MltF [Gammaproteobacteria bacterium]NIU07175.1 membrane-bound lytic murein transglycosylase MltF [Gammaproteobacteria bacterium]NIV53988.1 membrane-bound lytic murein transglycosylase MltF [Gammaproteobacteria bacterium]